MAVARSASTANSPVSAVASAVLPVIDIRGKVTDDKGDPLPGVTVVVKGTTNGTATGADGTYTLNLPEASGTLIFSYIGYVTREIPITGSQTTINVTLQVDAKTLEEVVVVGYGTQKKANVTGAVSSITVDNQVSSRAVPNVSSAMSGLVPGLAAVQSSGMAGRNGAALVIRGIGSVNGNSAPLVVVDGMPDIDINRIDMNDVESISVLKDAASAAVYGSRAANGVILITTKSGKGKKKATINFTSTNALETPVRSYDFMSDYPRALTLHQRAQAVGTLPSNFNFRNGTIDQWMAMGMIDPVRYPNTDWWNVIMRDGIISRQNLSASGGNDLSNFYISVGMVDQQGLQINNDYKQYNARINYDYKVRNNINVGIKLTGNSSKLSYALEQGFTDSDGTNTAGYDMQYAIAGILPYDPTTGYFGGVMAYGEDPQAYNPYTVYVNNLTRQNRQEANGNIFADWSPIEGLTARVDYFINYANQFQYNANMPNQAYNFQQGAFGSRVYVGSNAGISNRTDSDYKTMFTGRLTYNKKLAANHELGLLAVYSEEYWNERYQGSGRSDRLYPTLHEVDAALTLPGMVSASGGVSTEGLRSYIGRLNYTAFDKYLLEANFRYDGSSKFVEGSQFGFFPSVAVGWRFVEESFLKDFTSRFLSNGKLRMSYGGLGNNSGVGRYQQKEVLANNNYMIGNNIVKGFVYSKMINPDLSWESTNVFNLGLDLGFLDNRLSAELDYYNRLTTGMIRPSEFSIHLSGAYNPPPPRNIGNLRNRGVEANLNWSDNFREVRYGLNLNASYNRNVLESWNEFIGRGASHNSNQIFVNMPYGFIYSYEDMGIAQTWQDIYNATPQGASPGDILRRDLNGDGRIDGNDRKAYPNVQRLRPSTNFSLNANASYKGFDLLALFQGSTGRKDFWLNNYNNVNFGTQRYASTWQHWNNPWNLENRAGAWPRLAGNANREETTFWLDDMSFIRIKNLQLGYTIPATILNKIGVTSLRVFGSAENLATFTNFRGLDPEKGADRNDMYPIVKSYSLGVNLSL
ncbi:TonB-dependent receptor [Adhaeribacter rhizoryzae]|uniref:TonB-dependent receptor n=2 Tax=Adhaeribacter rhizoryzae TaxID=2607907 RepID=A0A5M6D8E9_9BACT|nr:TonB-dependent receptor [Adhaeribacter rhizoryzae]